MLFFCLSGSQHSTYYPGGIWHREKGMWMEQMSTARWPKAPHWTDRSLGSSWVLLSQHPPWEIHCWAGSVCCCAPHPPQSSDIQLLSLTVTLSRQQTKPWIMILLFKRTGKNNQARFVLSFRLSWEIDFYLKDPTWIGRLDFSHRSQITLSTEKSHYFCPKERQTFSKVL